MSKNNSNLKLNLDKHKMDTDSSGEDGPDSDLESFEQHELEAMREQRKMTFIDASVINNNNNFIEHTNHNRPIELSNGEKRKMFEVNMSSDDYVTANEEEMMAEDIKRNAEIEDIDLDIFEIVDERINQQEEEIMTEDNNEVVHENSYESNENEEIEDVDPDIFEIAQITINEQEEGMIVEDRNTDVHENSSESNEEIDPDIFEIAENRMSEQEEEMIAEEMIDDNVVQENSSASNEEIEDIDPDIFEIVEKIIGEQEDEKSDEENEVVQEYSKNISEEVEKSDIEMIEITDENIYEQEEDVTDEENGDEVEENNNVRSVESANVDDLNKIEIADKSIEENIDSQNYRIEEAVARKGSIGNDLNKTYRVIPELGVDIREDENTTPWFNITPNKTFTFYIPKEKLTNEWQKIYVYRVKDHMKSLWKEELSYGCC